MENNNVITDIIIPDGVQRLELKAYAGMIPANFDLRKMDRRYENITEIVIDDSVGSVRIRNDQFPNVKKVISYNSRYLSTNVLRTKSILLNTFEKPEYEIIDMEGIYRVEPDAFNGCKTTQICNIANKVMYYCDDDTPAMNGSAFEMKNGIIEIGNSIVRAEEGVVAHIYETVNYVSKCAAKNISGIRVMSIDEYTHIATSLSHEDFNVIDLHIAFDLNEKHLRDIDICETDFYSPVTRVKNYILEGKQSQFTSVDGIIYTKDMKVLYRYPKQKKMQKLVIPDYVKEIAPYAFYDVFDGLGEVYMPDSVTRVGKRAFGYTDCSAQINLAGSPKKTQPDCPRTYTRFHPSHRMGL